HDSRNGTFVNGVPIKQRQLEHGDSIRIGDHHFIFLLEEDEVVSAAAVVQLDDANPLTGATILLPREKSFYDHPEKLLTGLPASNRLMRDLNVLLKVGTAVSELRGVEALQIRLLELIFEGLPAERGAVMLRGRTGEEFAASFGRSRQSNQQQS